MRSCRSHEVAAGYCSRVAGWGSHIVLETEDPSHHRIAIPDHDALRIGTFNGILRAVSAHKGVTREHTGGGRLQIEWPRARYCAVSDDLRRPIKKVDGAASPAKPDRLKSHSVKTSCSVVKVDFSVFADTAPNFFPNRDLSTARI